MMICFIYILHRTYRELDVHTPATKQYSSQLVNTKPSNQRDAVIPQPAGMQDPFFGSFVSTGHRREYVHSTSLSAGATAAYNILITLCTAASFPGCLFPLLNYWHIYARISVNDDLLNWFINICSLPNFQEVPLEIQKAGMKCQSVRSHLDRIRAITLSCALARTIRLSRGFSSEI
jgi:hypothetical protein